MSPKLITESLSLPLINHKFISLEQLKTILNFFGWECATISFHSYERNRILPALCSEVKKKKKISGFKKSVKLFRKIDVMSVSYFRHKPSFKIHSRC